MVERERRGDYLGKTVQVVPHITDAICEWVQRVACIPIDGSGQRPDVCTIEVSFHSAIIVFIYVLVYLRIFLVFTLIFWFFFLEEMARIIMAPVLVLEVSFLSRVVSF